MTLSLTRRALALTALTLAIANPALAQKSASQQDWEDTQAAYLADNLKKPGWKATATGVQYKRTSKPNLKGAQPKADSTITINYNGQTITEVEFDASAEGEPMTTPLSDLVKGLREVIPMMHAGETWQFVIPAAMGYGERPRSKIPVMSTLVFKIELVAVK